MSFLLKFRQVLNNIAEIAERLSSRQFPQGRYLLHLSKAISQAHK